MRSGRFDGRGLVVVAALVALSGCAQKMMVPADKDKDVKIDTRVAEGLCQASVRTDTSDCTDQPDNTLCIREGKKAKFAFGDNQGGGADFSILPKEFKKNPLFDPEKGSSKCPTRSKNGKLECKVKRVGHQRVYEYWVVVDDCQPLDPRIYVH